MYRAIERFRDLTDGHLYESGDVFPYDGRKISEDRINTLATGRNASSKPLIAKDEEIITEAPETPKKATRGRKKAQ